MDVIALIDVSVLISFIEMLCSIILVIIALITLLITLIIHIKQTKK